MTDRKVPGTFISADDLLWAATQGELSNHGPIIIEDSPRIGPLIEMMYGSRAHANEYVQIAYSAKFAKAVFQAFSNGTISGTEFGANIGIFPVQRYDPTASDQSTFSLWKQRANSAATKVGFSRTFASGLIGAMLELNSNIIEHSEHPGTGLLAFAAYPDSFEFVVADSGVGVLTGLRSNPEFADLADAGIALKVAAVDGNSRHGSTSGRGFGIGQLFRALAGHNGELRFRSDDHVLTLSGDSPSLSGELTIAQRARLNGLIVSVICRSFR